MIFVSFYYFLLVFNNDINMYFKINELYIFNNIDFRFCFKFVLL